MQQTGAMRIVVTGKNIDVPPAVREYVEKKVGKLPRFFNEARQPMMAEVMLAVEREMQIAEVTVRVQSLVVRGEAKTGDLYASVDEAVDRLERQIRKYKTRIQKRLQSAPKLAEVQADQTYLEPLDEDEEEAEETQEPQVVRTKRFALKPMDVEEAIMQMELLGHTFFVFRNAGTEEINVVYRRKDGNYGLIEPE